MSYCQVCKQTVSDVRGGVCFDCATAGAAAAELPTFARMEDGRLVFSGVVAGRKRLIVGDGVDEVIRVLAQEVAA